METATIVGPHLHWQRQCEKAGRLLSVVVLLDGLIVFTGWALSVPILTTFLPGAEPTSGL